MQLLFNSLLESVLAVLKIAVIILPLMIGIEILKDLKIIDKLSQLTKPITGFLTVNEKSNVPMVVGLILGLFYGAGVIIQSIKEDNIDRRSIILMCVFLSICHALFEDTVIFAAIGANLIPILFARLIAAFIITFFLSRLLKAEEKI